MNTTTELVVDGRMVGTDIYVGCEEFIFWMYYGRENFVFNYHGKSFRCSRNGNDIWCVYTNARIKRINIGKPEVITWDLLQRAAKQLTSEKDEQKTVRVESDSAGKISRKSRVRPTIKT